MEPQCIHGDSNLFGVYSMAMTGSHYAMATADSVFLKNKHTKDNVIVAAAFFSTDPHEKKNTSEAKRSPSSMWEGLPKSVRPLVVCNKLSNANIMIEKVLLEEEIAHAVERQGMRSLLRRRTWQPSFVTPCAGVFVDVV